MSKCCGVKRITNDLYYYYIPTSLSNTVSKRDAPYENNYFPENITLPDEGSVSKYRVEASLTVFRVSSAEVPPITMAR